MSLVGERIVIGWLGIGTGFIEVSVCVLVLTRKGIGCGVVRGVRTCIVVLRGVCGLVSVGLVGVVERIGGFGLHLFVGIVEISVGMVVLVGFLFGLTDEIVEGSR